MSSWEVEYSRGHVLPGAPYTPFVPQEPFEYGPVFMPGRLNVRVPEGGSRHAAPDPSLMGGAYGEGRSRPAQVQVATTLSPWGCAMEDRFVFGPLGNVEYTPGVKIPLGVMQPHVERANITVPPHIAYGSLFAQDQPTYGYG